MARRRQHGEGSLYQRGADGLWVAVADLGWAAGKRDRRYFAAVTPAAALAKRQAFLDRRRDGFTMPKGRQPYVSEWLLHWLHNVAKRKIAETTWESSYRQKVTDLICPWFERIPLADLSEEDIEHWHAELERRVSERTGRPLSPATIGQCHRIFSAAIKAAVKRGRIGRNPLSNVTPPPSASPQPRPPSEAEVRLVLARCQTWPNGARWVLAICTGLRQGEALALRWADVRLADPAQIAIRMSAARVRGRGRVEKAPKSTGSRRSVPLPAIGARALRDLHAAQSVRDLSGLVFVTAAGRPVHPRVDYQDWLNLLADLGLPRYRVHDLRHAYATMLLESGQDPRVVQDLLGWSSPAMLEVYQHVRPVLHQRAARALDDLLGP